MNKLNIYNKLFLVFCALLIVVIIWKAPHEKDDKTEKKEKVEKKDKDEMSMSPFDE
jgi:hypothetical protein